MKEIKVAFATLITLPFLVHAEAEKQEAEITIAVATQYAPKYTGADEYNWQVAPYFEWKKDSWFISTEKGAGFLHQFDNGIYLGQSLGYSTGRTDEDSWFQEGDKKLRGMGKIKTALTTTSTVGWWILPWISVEGNVIAPLTASQGMQYNVKLNALIFDGENDTLMLSTEQKYADARYNNLWFGVNEQQSIASGFKKYSPQSGLYATDYSINWQHTFNYNWSSYADLRYTSLANSARKSPMTDRNDYFTFTVGALYTF